MAQQMPLDAPVWRKVGKGSNRGWTCLLDHHDHTATNAACCGNNGNCGNLMMMTTVAIGVTLAVHLMPNLGDKIHGRMLNEDFKVENVTESTGSVMRIVED